MGVQPRCYQIWRLLLLLPKVAMCRWRPQSLLGLVLRRSMGRLTFASIHCRFQNISCAELAAMTVKSFAASTTGYISTPVLIASLHIPGTQTLCFLLLLLLLLVWMPTATAQFKMWQTKCTTLLVVVADFSLMLVVVSTCTNFLS